jgi:hypothetical protein
MVGLASCGGSDDDSNVSDAVSDSNSEREAEHSAPVAKSALIGGADGASGAEFDLWGGDLASSDSENAVEDEDSSSSDSENDADQDSILDDSANGIWNGTVSADGGETSPVGAILSDGRIVAISQPAETAWSGSYTVRGDVISAEVTVYEMYDEAFGIAIGTATLSGTVIAQQEISLTYSQLIPDEESETTGSIYLSFNALYNEPTSLASSVGEWSALDGDLIIILDEEGSFYQQDLRECGFSGSLSQQNSLYNLYDTDASLCYYELDDDQEEIEFDDVPVVISFSGFSFIDERDRLQMVVSNSSELLLFKFVH